MEWAKVVGLLKLHGEEIMPRFYEKICPDGDYSNEKELRDLAYACWNGSYLMRDLLGEPCTIQIEDEKYFDKEFTVTSGIESGFIYHFLDKSLIDVHYFTIIRTKEKVYHIATYGGVPRIDAREVTEDINDILRSISSGNSVTAIRFFDIPEWDLESVKHPSRLYYHRHPIRNISLESYSRLNIGLNKNDI